MRNINVMALGFNPNSLPSREGITWVCHQPGLPEGLTRREYYQMCDNFVGQSTVLIVKNTNRKLDMDEVVLIHSAYTKSTPIFAVGHNMLSPLVDYFITNIYENMDELMDHLSAYYIGRGGK